MSTVETFDCQQCVHGADRDRFYYDLTVFGVRDMKTGWVLGIHTYRFGKALEIYDKAGSLLVIIYCSVKNRNLNDKERVAFPNDDVAIMWSVRWPAVYDQKPAISGLTRQYITDFFVFTKGRMGWAGTWMALLKMQSSTLT